MRKTLITAATFKPLEVDEVKLRPEINIAGTNDDLVIAEMIRTAIEAFEEYTGNIMCSSTWDLYLNTFPGDNFIETPGPLVSITSIKYLDTSGTEQTYTASYYGTDLTYNPLYGRIYLKYGQSWPMTYAQDNAVYIRCVIGWSNAGAIPQKVKDGMYLKIQEKFYGLDLSDAIEECWKSYRRFPI